MATLFALTGRWLELNGRLFNFDGEITDADKEIEMDALFEELEQTIDDVGEKIDSYIYVMAENDLRAEGMRAEAKRLIELANRSDATTEWMTAKLLNFFKVTNRKELQTPKHSLKIKGVGGKRAMELDMKDASELHSESFTKMTEPVEAKRVIDNDKVRKYLEEGGELSWARLREKGEKLDIK
jgi:hypothetical protein